MIQRFLAVIFTFNLFVIGAQAQTTNDWVTWSPSGAIIGNNTAPGNNQPYYGAATGTALDSISGNTVTLNLTGEVVSPYSCFSGSNCAYWAGPNNYISAPYVTVPPSQTTNMIAQTGYVPAQYAEHTITFSRPVSNVVMSFFSLGTPSQLSAYTFTQPFAIIKSASCDISGSFCITSSNNNLTINGKEGTGTILFRGTYSSLSWTVSVPEDFSGFNLGFSGVAYIFTPTTEDTQQSMANTAQVLQGTFTVLNTALVNSLAYDCQVFDKNNVCISAGGRNTAVSAANGLNATSALLIAAYRPHPNYRIGAYADQNLSVNNAGSTVNLGNNTPLVGLFGAWNERLDGTGAEVKVSAAYGQKNTTITRQVVGTSEAGSGGAPINSQGAQLTAKYGFGVTENIIVSPYIGMRYTQNNMNGYTEGATSSVTAPLTYSALNTNATTALAGVGAHYKFIPRVAIFASAGVETDTNTSNGSYYGTNSAIDGLTPVNFNINPVKTRPTATLGAYYDVEKNQRLGITGIYRQEPFQAVSTTTVMATYTVGL